jgi:ABC-2 type transport system ATP-binding protein
LFDSLNLTIKPGSIYGLLGKNGAGKTTLLNLINGTIFPQRGIAKVFGHDTVTRDKLMLQDIFFLCEDNIDYSISANEYLKIYGAFYPRFNPDKFYAIANEWHIRFQDKINNFSHGERKKFLIAFAIATKCRLILLDEPTNGLDIPAKSTFRSQIAGAISDETSMIISSHQVRDLEGLIDPIIILDNGKIILNETIERIEEQLSFGLSQTTPTDEDLLYSMPVPAGFAYVKKRHPDADYGARVDLELLFNAVTNNPGVINQLFGV